MNIFSSLLAAFPIVTLMSCSFQMEVSSSSQIGSYTSRERVWQSTDIDVCWTTTIAHPKPEHVNVGLETEEAIVAAKQMTQETVTRELQNKVGFVFRWHASCSNLPVEKLAIRIKLENTNVSDYAGWAWMGPTAVTNQDHANLHLVLQHLTGDWGKHVVLHEFGHALGLLHEQARDDSTCTRRQKGVDDVISDKFYKVGQFDPNSVMNYCSGSPTLSKGDIAGLYFLYPDLYLSKPVDIGEWAIKICNSTGYETVFVTTRYKVGNDFYTEGWFPVKNNECKVVAKTKEREGALFATLDPTSTNPSTTHWIDGERVSGCVRKDGRFHTTELSNCEALGPEWRTQEMGVIKANDLAGTYVWRLY